MNAAAGLALFRQHRVRAAHLGVLARKGLGHHVLLDATRVSGGAELSLAEKRQFGTRVPNMSEAIVPRFLPLVTWPADCNDAG
ncbi:MAG: hypothetical protein HYV63_33375 [Candidatus Schekmanbacteria bacterium]|nr:hypothetical protein [Candidatus Schekmanbacteria bacterium]